MLSLTRADEALGLIRAGEVEDLVGGLTKRRALSPILVHLRARIDQSGYDAGGIVRGFGG